MKKGIVLFLAMILGGIVFAKSYNAEVFKSNIEDKLNVVELETEDSDIKIKLENGEISLDENDVITAKGKAYVVITLDNGKTIIIRNDTVQVKELVKK